MVKTDCYFYMHLVNQKLNEDLQQNYSAGDQPVVRVR